MLLQGPSELGRTNVELILERQTASKLEMASSRRESQDITNTSPLRGSSPLPVAKINQTRSKCVAREYGTPSEIEKTRATNRAPDSTINDAMHDNIS